MKIALISDTMAPTNLDMAGHGLGRAVAQLAESLYALGHEVTLYGVEGSYFSGQTVCLGGSGKAPIKQRSGLESAMTKLVYKHHEHYDAFIDASHKKILAAYFPDLPIVNWVHDKWMPHRRNSVIPSEGVREQLAPEFKTAKVIHNQIDPRGFMPSYRADDNPAYAMFLGFVYKWKNPILAIEAASRARMKLCIGGQFENGTPELFSGQENVVLLGALPPTVRNELLRGASVYLQLGDSESFGLTTIEAGLCGTPVVAWPSDGNLDTVKPGVNGVFVDIRNPDKVEATVLAIRQAKELNRKTCYEYVVNNFGCPEVQAQQFEGVLEQVVRGETW